ncbi:YciI family protein [Catelliglobosispora koreensis]|uniref:YciI family protein n=1 Tax=Catelliglobosispora koreensis TaxID=129052 RepID=UPI0003693627|nr:YciI family protein [Catelliglobosispora koreensis]
MRVLVLLRGDEASEAGELPSHDIVDQMMKFNADLAEAGVLLLAEGLRPSSDGARTSHVDGKKTVVDGPFAEAKEVVVGFWVWDVANMDEAKQWALRCPAELEIRPVFETADFGDHLTEEQRALDEQIRSGLGDS